MPEAAGCGPAASEARRQPHHGGEGIQAGMHDSLAAPGSATTVVCLGLAPLSGRGGSEEEHPPIEVAQKPRRRANPHVA